MTEVRSIVVVRKMSGAKTEETDITELMRSVWNLCNIQDNSAIVEILESMFICCIEARELLADEQIDDILGLYLNLKWFFKKAADELLEIQ